MGSLKDQIDQKTKDAMKAREADTVSILRMLRAAIKNKEIDAKESLDDTAVITVIQKMVKQAKESIDQFKKGNRQDLVDKTEKELGILQPLLPQQMDVGALKAGIENIVKETGATSMKQMGQVMKEVTAKFSGQADMKEASRIVRELLAKGQ